MSSVYNLGENALKNIMAVYLTEKAKCEHLLL